MTSPLDLINRPRKRKDDYFEFIALSGKHEAFDLDKTEACLSRSELKRCEAMFHIKGDRWVLAYVPFPVEIPPWVVQHSLADQTEPWEQPLPPNRELDREDAARWFQIINEYVLPEGLEPVAESQGRGRRGEPTRLDHEWRAPGRSTSEEKNLVTDARPEVSCQVTQTTSATRAKVPKTSKAKPRKRRNGGQGERVVGYLVTFIESCLDAQKAGLPVPPLESQAQLAKRLNVSEATVSRAGREWFHKYNIMFMPKAFAGRRNDDGSIEAYDHTNPTEM